MRQSGPLYYEPFEPQPQHCPDTHLGMACSPLFLFKWRGTLLHGGYLYFIFHPKWSKLCKAFLMGSRNPIYQEISTGGTYTVVFFTIQNRANSAQPLLWVPRSPLLKKNSKKYYLTPFSDLLNCDFLLILRFFQRVPTLLFFIIRGAVQSFLHFGWKITI